MSMTWRALYERPYSALTYSIPWLLLFAAALVAFLRERRQLTFGTTRDNERGCCELWETTRRKPGHDISLPPPGKELAPPLSYLMACLAASGVALLAWFLSVSAAEHMYDGFRHGGGALTTLDAQTVTAVGRAIPSFPFPAGLELFCPHPHSKHPAKVLMLSGNGNDCEALNLSRFVPDPTQSNPLRC